MSGISRESLLFLLILSVLTAALGGCGGGSSTSNTPPPPPPPSIQSVALNPSTVTAGTVSNGTVTLNGPAPTGGIAVALMSNNSGVANPTMASVTVPANSTSAQFTVDTFAVGGPTNVTITGTLNGAAMFTLTVDPASSNSVAYLFFNPPTVVGGTGVTATGTVILKSAAASNTPVVLASSDPSVSVPANVTVNSGTSSATFQASASAVGTPKIATITATLGGNVNNTLTDNPAATSTSSEQIIVAGETDSADFPVTTGSPCLTAGQDSGYVTSVNLMTDTLGNISTTQPATFSACIGQGNTATVGTNLGHVRDVFVDANGNVYACGVTGNQSLPTTPGVIQPSFTGTYRDGFLVKFSPTGSILALTYIGGKGTSPNPQRETICYSIFVDAAGFVYASGRTSADDFPTTPGAFQTGYGGGNATAPHFGGDFWVAKLKPDFAGPTPVWATYVGGIMDDTARGRLNIDPVTKEVIVGGASIAPATTFPVPLGSIPPTMTNAMFFGVVIKLSADGTNLVYTKFFFGNTPAAGATVTNSNASGDTIVNAAGDAYVCGFTTATDFITSSGGPPGGLRTTLGGSDNSYVARISRAGQITAMTLVGGTGGGEECKGLAFDSEGNVVLLSDTSSTDYPTTLGAFQVSPPGTAANMAVTKLTPDLSHIIFSTYVGGSGRSDSDAARIALDSNENIYLDFYTFASDLLTKGVVTPNAFQPNFAGSLTGCKGLPCSDDVFVKLSADGSRVLYGSYLGGTGSDNPRTLGYHKN
jgi:hypothetical protein